MINIKFMFNDTMHKHIYKYLLNTFVFLNPRQKTKLKKTLKLKLGFIQLMIALIAQYDISNI